MFQSKNCLADGQYCKAHTNEKGVFGSIKTNRGTYININREWHNKQWQMHLEIIIKVNKWKQKTSENRKLNQTMNKIKLRSNIRQTWMNPCDPFYCDPLFLMAMDKYISTRTLLAVSYVQLNNTTHYNIIFLNIHSIW